MWQIAADFITFLGWFFENIGVIIQQIFTPVQYIFSFTKNFFINAFAPPESFDEIWTFSDSILGIFNAIPHWQLLITVLGIGLMIIFGIVILKLFLKT